MTKKYLWLSLLAVLAILTACGDYGKNSGKDDPKDDQKNLQPTLTENLQPTFTNVYTHILRSCGAQASCHESSTSSYAAEIFAFTNTTLRNKTTAYAAIVGKTCASVGLDKAGCENTFLIKAGAVNESYLIGLIDQVVEDALSTNHNCVPGYSLHVQNKAIPSAAKVQLLKDWVKKGAPND